MATHTTTCYLQLQAVYKHGSTSRIDHVKVVAVTQNKPANPSGDAVVKLVLDVDDEVINPDAIPLRAHLTNQGGKGASILSQEVVWDGTT